MLKRLLAGAVLLALVGPAAAQDTRAAIIDAAWDTRPYIDRLKANGVEVIGRYYARCRQPERNLPSKRLIDQGPVSDRQSEVRRILDNGMAILSIYQFNNDSKFKFVGKDRDGKPLPDAACRPTTRERTPAQEGQLDAQAAITQARALGQPRGSAIYFGVDIAFSKSDAATGRAMVEYMRAVRKIVTRAGYKLGAYANGDALEVLSNERLIEYAWLSASRAYPGSSRVHNSGRWHLFQNGVNLLWFSGTPPSCTDGLPLDTNVKNAAYADDTLGFWNRRGVVRVAPRRTRAIYAARRFACDGDARIRKSASSGPRDTIASQTVCRGRRAVSRPSTVDYANSVRLGRTSGELVEVDYDEDGAFDGWTAKSNLSQSFAAKPEWIFAKGQRRRARCP